LFHLQNLELRHQLRDFDGAIFFGGFTSGVDNEDAHQTIHARRQSRRVVLNREDELTNFFRISYAVTVFNRDERFFGNDAFMGVKRRL